MKRVVFSKYARQELEDAVEYHELKFPGLGDKLKDEVKKQ